MLRTFGFQRVVGLTTLLIPCALGCSSESKPAINTPVYKYPAVSDFCAAIAQAECSTTVGTVCSVPDTTVCVREVTNACTMGKSDVTTGKQASFYRPEKAETCVSAVKTAYSNPQMFFALSDVTTLASACDPVFSPNHAAGDTCSIDSDCTSPLQCFLTAPGRGQCQMKVAIKAGDPCSQPGSVCEDDLHYCSPDGCVRKPANTLGMPCTISHSVCSSDQLCTSSGTTDGSFVCASKLAAQAPCTAGSVYRSDQCQSGLCSLGRTGTSSVCVNSVQLVFLCSNFDGHQ